MENFKDIQYPYCQDVIKYEKICGIGKGTFGEVYKAKCKKNGMLVALKKFLIDNDKNGVPLTTLREIKLLSVLRHENIVSLIEICRKVVIINGSSDTEFYLVLEFCNHDLSGLLANSFVNFTLAEKKKIIKMILNGLHFIHFNKIIHRDLKTSNVLIDSKGIVKIADFGLARPIHSIPSESIPEKYRKQYTTNVVTLWYRAPEILLGDRAYGPAIDIWSLGCIVLELWTRTPIFKGDNENMQLNLIMEVCGSISPKVWPGVDKFNLYKSLKLPQGLSNNMRRKIWPILKNDQAFDLIKKMLTLDPKTRINCEDALENNFLWSNPLPCNTMQSIVTLKSSNHELTVATALQKRPRPPPLPANESSERLSCMYPSRIY